MKAYMILKPVYNERAGRFLHPGEAWTFDDAQAVTLIERGLIRPTVSAAEQRQAAGQPVDAELDKLTDL